MVQRQWFLCTLQRVSLVQLERIILHGMVQLQSVTRSELQLVRVQWTSITHLSTVEHASVGPMEAGERWRDDGEAIFKKKEMCRMFYSLD